MNFSNVIRSRHSIRKFLDKSVPDTLIAQILELAKLAPSAGNLQAYKVVVVKDKEVKSGRHTFCQLYSACRS